MKKLILFVALTAVTFGLSAPAANAKRPGSKVGTGSRTPQALAPAAPANGVAGSGRPSLARPAAAVPQVNNNQPLYYYGGPVQTYNRNYAIFWVPSNWYVPSSYYYLIYRYFADVSGSGLYNINKQYYSIYNGTRYYIKNDTAWVNYYVDTRPYPANRCTNPVTGARCILDSDIQAEVQRVMGIKGWSGGTSNAFYVYTAYGEGSCFTSTCASAAYRNYCAYHYSFYSSSRAEWILYANMPYSNSGHTTTCHNSLPGASPNGNREIDSEISVTSHEHFEIVTDPYGGVSGNQYAAWQDPSGVQGENGDKCAYKFGSVFANGGNQYWNGHYYIIQQEWSNNAFRNGVGSPRGCVKTGP